MASAEETLLLATQVTNIFKAYDANGDGTISPAELSEVFQILDSNKFDKERCVVLFQQVDRNGNGMIEYTEFINYVCDDRKAAADKSALVSNDIVRARELIVAEEKRKKAEDKRKQEEDKRKQEEASKREAEEKRAAQAEVARQEAEKAAAKAAQEAEAAAAKAVQEAEVARRQAIQEAEPLLKQIQHHVALAEALLDNLNKRDFPEIDHFGQPSKEVQEIFVAIMHLQAGHSADIELTPSGGVKDSSFRNAIRPVVSNPEHWLFGLKDFTSTGAVRHVKSRNMDIVKSIMDANVFDWSRKENKSKFGNLPAVACEWLQHMIKCYDFGTEIDKILNGC